MTPFGELLQTIGACSALAALPIACVALALVLPERVRFWLSRRRRNRALASAETVMEVARGG